MDPYVIQRVAAATPKFNDSLCNGLAIDHLMKVNPETGKNAAMAYIDRLFQINHETFPEGLVYDGSQICSPITHFEKLTTEYNSKRQANIARNDTYLIKLQFSYHGETLFPRFVQIPFIGDGGLLTLNGATYSVSPVLTDVGFSVLQGSIFIPLRKIKLTFNRIGYHFLANGRRCIVYVIWSSVHSQRVKNPRLPKRRRDGRRDIETTLVHYLFCRYGLTETFRLWGKTNVMYGVKSNFPADEYPRDQYTIFESIALRGRHPAGDICLVIPVEGDSEFTRMLVGGFFYLMDTFPDRFSTTSMDELSNFVDGQAVDEYGQVGLGTVKQNSWRRLLGNLIWGDFEPYGKLLENVDDHMYSNEHILDEMTREDLRSRSLHVDNLWDLMVEVMTTLSHHFYQISSDEASMYGKRLMIQRYVMEEFNNAISRFSFSFQTRRNKVYTADEINALLKKYFKLNTCVAALTSQHGEINTVSYPGDNKIFRLTSMLIPQDKARRKGGFSKSQIGDTSHLLHASIAEVGQFNNQPKNNPDGRGRVSPNLNLDVDGTVRPDPEKAALIARTNKMFER